MMNEGQIELIPPPPPQMEETLPPFEFPSPSLPSPCSFAECEKGHRWQTSLALTPCVGCGAPTLMAKMENCPYCNEPTLRISLRHDHLPKGGGVAKRCKGQKPHGETMDILLERSHFKDVEK